MKHTTDGNMYTSNPPQCKCKVCGAFYFAYGDDEGCPGAAPQPTSAQRELIAQRLCIELGNCVTLAMALQEPAPRRVVAWRFVRDDGHAYAWSDGDYPHDAAPTSKQWRVERAYSE